MISVHIYHRLYHTSTAHVLNKYKAALGLFQPLNGYLASPTAEDEEPSSIFDRVTINMGVTASVFVNDITFSSPSVCISIQRNRSWPLLLPLLLTGSKSGSQVSKTFQVECSGSSIACD